MKQDSKFQESCPICYLKYNTKSADKVIPMVVCLEQHLCCQECVKKISNSKYLTCPLCRKEDITIDRIRKFRYFQCFQNMSRKISEIQLQKNCEIQLLKLQLKQKQQDLKKLLLQNQNSIQKIIHKLKEEAIVLFKFGRFKEASRIFQIILEKNPQQDQAQFIGLGNMQESVGFYQRNVYQWFEKRYKQKQISIYDLLALCYLSQPNYQAQKDWYSQMLKKYPNNTKIIYGLGITEHNANKLDEAETIYNSLIEIDPLFSKPYQMLGFIHLTKENPQKYFRYASKCLSFDPKNIFAKFLVAYYKFSNKDDTGFRKQILDICNEQKQYVRPCQMLKNNNYLQTIQILQNVLSKDTITNRQKLDCYKYLGAAYSVLVNDAESLRYYRMYFFDQNYSKDFNSTKVFVLVHESNEQKSKTITLCQQLLKRYPNQQDLIQTCRQIIIRRLFSQKSYRQAFLKLAEYQKYYSLLDLHYFYLAEGFYQLGKYSECKSWCLQCIDKNIKVKEVNEFISYIDRQVSYIDRQGKDKYRYQNKDDGCSIM